MRGEVNLAGNIIYLDARVYVGFFLGIRAPEGGR